MIPEGFLSVDRIQRSSESFSKKRLLQQVAELLALADNELDGNTVFDGLQERERLGATGLGHGVGLPHTRIEGIASARAALILLDEPVPYDAEDRQPVDLVCALMVPKEEHSAHLEILASLAGLFSSADHRKRLRELREPGEILALFDELLRAEA